MFEICFTDDFYYADGTADTVFYIRVNGVYFPDDQWTDFAVAVLQMWISDVLDNYRSDHAEFDLYFMDGPYSVHCIKQGPTVHMRCVEDKRTIITIAEGDVQITEMIRELADVSDRVIRAVKEHGFGRMRDLQKLERSRMLLTKTAIP